MHCLNIKNKQVAATLQECTELLDGMDGVAYQALANNEGLPLDRVPIGDSSAGLDAESLLYKALLDYYGGDAEMAKIVRMKTLTDDFRTRFAGSNQKDKNGEPTLDYLISHGELQPREGNRSKELAEVLHQIYPEIQIGNITNPNVRGQAKVEAERAGYVLLNVLNEKQDTLPHEYAHHYIAWFHETPIVQRGIKMFGSDEALVQAIGSNSVKALKWYNRLFNWIKGVFNHKQRVLNELTSNFLSGKELGETSAITGIYSQEAIDLSSLGEMQIIPESVPTLIVDENGNVIVEGNNRTQRQAEQEQEESLTRPVDEETLNKIHNVLETIKNRMRSRIKTLRYAKKQDKTVIEQTEKLLKSLDMMDSAEAIIQVMDNTANNLTDALQKATEIYNRVKESERQHIPMTVTFDEIDLLQKGYLDFYKDIEEKLNQLLNSTDQSFWQAIPSQKIQKQLKSQFQKIAETYINLNNTVVSIQNSMANNAFINYATEQGSWSVDSLSKVLTGQSDAVDINLWDEKYGMSQFSSSELVQIIVNQIAQAKIDVDDAELKIGRELVALMKKCDKKKLHLLYEKDEKGRRTAFFVRKENYGAHFHQYRAFLRKMADDLGFQDIPLDEVVSRLDTEQSKYWYRKINEWDAKYTIRRFKPGYYTLLNELSVETRKQRDIINLEIQQIYEAANAIDEDGFPHREMLNEEQYAALLSAERRRKNLASAYNLDGTPKRGQDLESALELQKYNKIVREKLLYKPNLEKWKAARAKAKRELSPEQFKIWDERNSIEHIKSEFWDDVKQLASKNTNDTIKKLQKERNELLSLYRRQDGSIDATNMPSSLKKAIVKLDKKIAKERKAVATKSGKSHIEDIGEWKVQPEFYEQYELHKDDVTWLQLNTWYDKEAKKRKPQSFWCRLYPKDTNKYVSFEPTSTWSELDPNSPFLDERFRQYADRGENRIPNPAYFNNSSQYEQVMADPNLKALYERLLQVMKESNDKLYFLRYRNNYLMPQIEGDALDRMKKDGNFFERFGYTIMDRVITKDTDMEYNTAAERTNSGARNNLIPTRFLKLLDDPNTITSDIVGAVIKYYRMAENFKKMSELAPKLNVELARVGNLKFQNDKDGLESRVYSKLADYINQQVYETHEDPIETEVTIKGKKVKINWSKGIDGLIKYTRLCGIAHNLPVLLTSIMTAKWQEFLTAQQGVYFDNKDIRQAAKCLALDLGHAAANIGSSLNKSKPLCFLELMQCTRRNAKTFDRLHMSRVARFLYQHFWYGGYEMSDYAIKGEVALACAFAYRYDGTSTSGEFRRKIEFITKYGKEEGLRRWNAATVTFYDAYEMKDGNLVLKEQYKAAAEKIRKVVQTTIKQQGTIIDSQLTDLDASWAEATLIGKLILIFRAWIIVALQSKFITKLNYNYSTHGVQEASYPAAWHALLRMFNPAKLRELQEFAHDNWKEIDIYEKSCLKRVALELFVGGIMFSLFSWFFLQPWADDDPDNWWKQEVAYVGMRTALENRTNLIPVEAFKLFKSPTAAWSITENFITSLTQMFADDADMTVTSGAYQGFSRRERAIWKATPFGKWIENADPQSKREYQRNMEIFSFGL